MKELKIDKFKVSINYLNCINTKRENINKIIFEN